MSNWTSCRTIQRVIVLVISNRLRASCLSDFEITPAITPWIVLHSVQLLLLIVSTLLNQKLEKYFALVRIWHYKSVEITVCVTEFNSSSCHDEVILSLPCDQSVFHLLTCILKRILETVAVVLCCLVNKSVVKWFVQRCPYKNYMQG